MSGCAGPGEPVVVMVWSLAGQQCPPCFDSDVAGGSREGESSDSVRPGGHVT